MLIQAAKGRAKVAVYDTRQNRLVDYGWVEIQAGWTLTKYDWDKFQKSREGK